jgi:hypothetical protein
MDVRSEVRKGKGIEEVLGSHSGQSVDSSRTVETVGESYLVRLFKKYEHDETSEVTEVLSPGEIDSLLFIAAEIEEEGYDSYQTGCLIGLLINNSYNAGNDDFVLNTHSINPEYVKKLSALGALLEGEPDRPINLTINGYGGDYVGDSARHSNITVTDGAGEFLGAHAKGSTFTVHGDTGRTLATCAEDCTFRLYGRLHWVGPGDIGPRSKGCTFISDNKKTVDSLLTWLPPDSTIAEPQSDGSHTIIRYKGESLCQSRARLSR